MNNYKNISKKFLLLSAVSLVAFSQVWSAQKRPLDEQGSWQQNKDQKIEVLPPVTSKMHLDQVRSAIESGDHARIKAMCEQISLHHRLVKAIKRNDFDQVKSCLEKCRGSGVDITAKDRETLLTPLQLAVDQGDKRIIVLLRSF